MLRPSNVNRRLCLILATPKLSVRQQRFNLNMAGRPVCRRTNQEPMDRVPPLPVAGKCGYRQRVADISPRALRCRRSRRRSVQRRAIQCSRRETLARVRRHAHESARGVRLKFEQAPNFFGSQFIRYGFHQLRIADRGLRSVASKDELEKPKIARASLT